LPILSILPKENLDLKLENSKQARVLAAIIGGTRGYIRNSASSAMTI
jgi:hypothetical protein